MEHDETPTGHEKELLLEALAYPRRSVDVDNGIARIWALAEEKSAPSKAARRPFLSYAVGVAALLIVIGLWQFLPTRDTTVPNTEGKIYTTKAGQRASLTLSDGAQVTLGPATTLYVRNTDGTTDIQVDGEAFFRVRHAAQHPFVVTSHGVTTRVLGTEFVVRAYDGGHVRVAVREGRVSVQSPVSTSANAAVATSGEAISATQSSLPVIAPIADLATDFAWANGELVLNGVPVGEAFIRLSRWYGIDFRVADASLLDDTVNGTFPSAINIGDIESLARLMNARVTRSGQVFTFSLLEK